MTDPDGLMPNLTLGQAEEMESNESNAWGQGKSQEAVNRALGISGAAPPDWVMNNKTKEVHNDPNVHKASDVKDGETYIGASGKYIADNGSEVFLFSNGRWRYNLEGMTHPIGPNDIWHPWGGANGLGQFGDLIAVTTNLIGGGMAGIETGIIARSLSNIGSEAVEEGTTVIGETMDRVVDAAAKNTRFENFEHNASIYRYSRRDYKPNDAVQSTVDIK